MGTDLVTGASGFVGAHVVRVLLARGRAVRALVRAGSDHRALEGLEVERVEGDVRDRDAVARAVRGVDTVYHTAADYRLYVPDPEALVATNVGGTNNVLGAAAEAGARRIVHTSSVGALASASAERPADEDTRVDRRALVGVYKRSKYDAERVAERWAARGAPVIIVSPSTPVGELDVRPTPTGRIIVDFLAGRIPAFVDTGLNLVDVRDVAEGHALAAERGRPGRRYILGNENVSLRLLLERLATVSGRTAPHLQLPRFIPIILAGVQAALARLTHGTPRIPLDAARMAARPMYVDPGRAIRELGLPQSPVDAALARAVAWFWANGYV